MEQEQPKDYEKIYDQLVKDAYLEASIFEKIIFNMQDHLLLVIASSIIVGYLAGMTYGKFW